MTAGTLINQSLRLLGAAASGEALDPTQASDYLEILNQLLDAWAAERLTMYTQGRNAYSLSNGTQRYTFGTGGTWNGTRPLWIDRATRVDASGNETEIAVFTADEWAAVPDKSRTGTIPEGVYVNKTYPLAAADVYPVPSGTPAYQIVIYGPSAPLRSVAALTTTISAPEGWPRALRYNLAIELSPEVGIPAMESVIAIAVESKAAIKRPNEDPGTLAIDAGLLELCSRSSLSAADFESM